MSKVTDKWGNCQDKIMSREEFWDRWNEIQEMNPDSFYTDGKIDIEKIQRDGLTHFIKSASFDSDGKLTECKLYNDHTGYVYLITSENGLTKIGKAEDVKSRFSQIDGSSPCKVEIHHCQLTKNCDDLEKLLHKEFSHKRVKGEWFNLSPDELARAKEMIDSYEWKSQTQKS